MAVGKTVTLLVYGSHSFGYSAYHRPSITITEEPVDQVTIQRLNEINRAFYNRVAQDFDETRQQAWPGWDTLLSYLNAPLNAPLSVLDVGCGNGRFGLFLAQRLSEK